MAIKVLFISHSAGRTGAPLLLLNGLTWIKAHTQLEFEILLCADGPLRVRFEELAPTRVLKKPGWGRSLSDQVSGWLSNFSKGFPRQSSRARTCSLEEIVDVYGGLDIDLIYANTITLGTILEALADLRLPVITHVHEMDYWIERSGKENLRQIRKYTTRFVAASAAVRDTLTERYNFRSGDIDVIYSFVPLGGATLEPERVSQLRSQLSIASSDHVVVASGFETERKGKDLFIDLAQKLLEHSSDLPWKFLWVGGWESRSHRSRLLRRARQFGVEQSLIFVGEVADPLSYFALGDVFVLTSREEPLGLVALEASLLGLPVVCFEGSGGLPELIEADAGICVEYLDTGQMAHSVARLISDPGLAKSMNSAAVHKIIKRHSVSVGATAQIQCIEKTLSVHQAQRS